MAPVPAPRIEAARLDGTLRPIVDRAGMNLQPQFLAGWPLDRLRLDRRRHGSCIAPRGLTIVPAEGGDASRVPRIPTNDAWVNEFVWARDSRSIYLQANDGTFGRGEHMFEQPVVRVCGRRRARRAHRTGPTVDFSISLSQRRPRGSPIKSVEARTMGDVVVMDAASRPRHEDHRRQPGAAATSRSAI